MPTFDLEERMLTFAKNVRDFLLLLQKTVANRIYTEQLLRSSSSVGANYIEANDALGKKDFLVKIKISRREAKETLYWLRLLEIHHDQSLQQTHIQLLDEAQQLIRILSSIASKVQNV